MGTPDFAVPSLEALAQSEKYNVKAVYTQPDKPVGRKRILTPPDVKVCAEKYNMDVFQPTTFKDEAVVEELKAFAPDVIVVIAYGKILPKTVLDIPKYGCVNIHGSLLPKLRGAAPIQRAVIDGEEETGVTSMLMDVGLDTGDMLIKESVKILPNETAGELFDRLSKLGTKVLFETLEKIENGTVTREKQDDSLSTYAAMLSKEESVIDWNLSAKSVHNKVRGMNPWPVAVTVFKGKKLKIFKTKVCEKNGTPGKVISVSPPIVACGEGSVELLEVQLEGKKLMSAADFFRGQRIAAGDVIE
ncbi:MAG: methionyl-tRNA formyltransferase [Clostridia bacterium]|nr:methionyl-tRNA formyltransferase [Clostridia bacterium]